MGYASGDKSAVRRGTLKIEVSNANGSANGICLDGIENPENEVILVDRVVVEIITAAEAACNFIVGIGDNATDNVLASVELINYNAQNIGVVEGIKASLNSNCRVAAHGAVANAFIMAGASVNTNCDSLVAGVYVDYIIP